MKILLAGLGDWGSKHFRVLESLPVELYCCDVNAERGGGRARFSVNHRDFLPEMDAVVIVTPGPAHFALALECLEAGKDVFVEKPLAATAPECRQLAELAEARGRILQVGHIFRFDAATRWLRDAVQSSKFGRIRMIRSRFCGFKRPRRDGGGMISDGIHFVDLINHLLGSNPRSVQAIQHDFLGGGMDDASILSLEYPTATGPVWATVETDYFTPGKRRELTIVGECLTVVCDYTAGSEKIKTYENRHAEGVAVAGATTEITTPGEEPLRAELRAFIESVGTRAQPLADGWAGFEAVRVMNAAAESARTAKVIAMK
jgi:UDP-2-acetamido-3-amino-2,3-dideoxy-glucuronate N-acetyltransferase